MDRRGFLGAFSVGAIGILGVPMLGKLSPRQVEQLTKKEVEANTREHVEAVLNFFDNKDKIKNCTMLLTNNGETYKGPKIDEFELIDKPLCVTLKAEPHQIDKPFDYDGVQVVMFDGACLPPMKFATPVNVNEGDTLHVNWTCTL